MKIPILLLLAGMMMLVSCSPAVVSNPTPSTPEIKTDKKSTAAALGIPPGHLPPPGKCRVWIPGTPPGHQPKAGPCSVVAESIPPGAWLITRTSSDKKHVRVQFYDERRAGFIVAVGLYDAKNGTLVKDLSSKKKYAGK